MTTHIECMCIDIDQYLLCDAMQNFFPKHHSLPMLFIARSNVVVQRFDAQPCRADSQLTALTLRSRIIEQPCRVSISKVAAFNLPAQDSLLVQASVFAQIEFVRIFGNLIGVIAIVVTASQVRRP